MNDFLNYTITYAAQQIGSFPANTIYAGALLLLAGVAVFRQLSRV